MYYYQIISICLKFDFQLSNSFYVDLNTSYIHFL